LSGILANHRAKYRRQNGKHSIPLFLSSSVEKEQHGTADAHADAKTEYDHVDPLSYLLFVVHVNVPRRIRA
jgi:hypothetical protein